MKSKNQAALWLSLICLAGFAAQWILTWTLFDRLTFEELAESIRNPYWIANRDLYDGISSNVVYYKLLDFYYHFTGFHLFAAKELRLLLSSLSICAVGVFIYCCTPAKIATRIALLCFLLSPTLLYFGTHQASFGIDLQIFPIIGVIWVCSLRSNGWLSMGLFFLVAFLTVLLASMFPPGLFYIPALVLTDLFLRFHKCGRIACLLKATLPRLCVFAAGLLAGLVVPFLLVNDPGRLFFDPETHAGLFRGGGKISLHPLAFLNSLWRSVQDLFVLGDSYQFYLPHPEFGTLAAYLGLLVMFGLLIASILKLRPFSAKRLLECSNKPNAIIAIFAGILFLTFLIFGHLSPNLPGLRRSTGLLIRFYLFYYLAIEGCLNIFHERSPSVKWAVVLVLCILPVSHVFQLTGNLRDLPKFSRQSYPDWLKTESTAPESLTLLYLEE